MIPNNNSFPSFPSREDQLRKLYLDQKQTLDLFLKNGAITQAQYDKSLGDLTRKMGITDPEKTDKA